MRNYSLEREQWVSASLDDVFDFFSQATNLEALTPPWLSFRILTPHPVTMAAGTQLAYDIGWRFVHLRWLTEIVEWNPPTGFVDIQLRGPYKLWRHTHAFFPDRGGTIIRDSVRYGLPFGPLGTVAHVLTVRRDVHAIFDYRAKRVAELFASSPTSKARASS